MVNFIETGREGGEREKRNGDSIQDTPNIKTSCCVYSIDYIQKPFLQTDLFDSICIYFLLVYTFGRYFLAWTISYYFIMLRVQMKSTSTPFKWTWTTKISNAAIATIFWLLVFQMPWQSGGNYEYCTIIKQRGRNLFRTVENALKGF